jgi:hypothetical protein
MFKFTLDAGHNKVFLVYPKQSLYIYIPHAEDFVAVLGPLTPQEAAFQEGGLDCEENCTGH